MVSFTGLTAMKANGTAAGADAFQIYSPYAPFVQAKINNLRCNVEASATNTTNWNSCFHGTNIVRSHIDGIIMENGGGATNNGDPTMGMAVWLDGTNGGYSADNQLLHLSMAQGFAMVAATGHVEGLQIAQSTAVGSAYCVWMPGRQRDPSTGFYDYMTLTDTHCNSAIRGVYSVEAGSAKIINNLFYATNGSTSVAPPHGRGWSRGPEPMRHMPAGSPAWAGMVPRRRPTSPAARRLPRMGGDGPYLSGFHAKRVAAPPQGRGWSSIGLCDGPRVILWLALASRSGCGGAEVSRGSPAKREREVQRHVAHACPPRPISRRQDCSQIRAVTALRRIGSPIGAENVHRRTRHRAPRLICPYRVRGWLQEQHVTRELMRVTGRHAPQAGKDPFFECRTQ